MKSEKEVVGMITRRIYKKNNLLHNKDYKKSKELQEGVIELDKEIKLLMSLFEG